VQAGAVLYFSLLHGKNAAAEVGDPGQFVLDFLEPFMALAVGYLSFRFGVGLTAVLLVQFLKLSNLKAEISDLFTKHCEMVHDNRIAHSIDFFEPVLRNGGDGVGSRVAPDKREIPSASLRAGSSLRLKSGSALDDATLDDATLDDATGGRAGTEAFSREILSGRQSGGRDKRREYHRLDSSIGFIDSIHRLEFVDWNSIEPRRTRRFTKESKFSLTVGN
jgi:hypothetical protein